MVRHFSSVASFLSMLSMLLMVIQPANDVMIINDLVEEVGLKFLDLSNYESDRGLLNGSDRGLLNKVSVPPFKD